MYSGGNKVENDNYYGCMWTVVTLITTLPEGCFLASQKYYIYFQVLTSWCNSENHYWILDGLICIWYFNGNFYCRVKKHSKIYVIMWCDKIAVIELSTWFNIF